MTMGTFISITGPDRCKRIAAARNLVEFLRDEYYPVAYIHVRFPYFFTLVWQLLVRILKRDMTCKQQEIDARCLSKKVSGFFYIWAVTVDSAIQYLIRIGVGRKIGLVLVSDRGLIDVLVDLVMDMGSLSSLNSGMTFPLHSLASLPNVTVFVDVPETVADRPQTQVVGNLNIIRRRALYRKIRAAYGIPVLSTKSELIRYVQGTGIYTGTLREPYLNVKFPLWRLFFSRKEAAYAVNWLFQGIKYSTWSERCFKFLFDLAILGLLVPLLSLILPPLIAGVAGFFMAHTINWTFNGSMRIIGKFYGETYQIKKNLSFLLSLKSKKDLLGRGALAVAMYGSLSRGQFGESSDIDMCMIRNPGFVGWIRSNLFALSIRSRAFLENVPLGLIVVDSVSDWNSRIRADEPPVVLFDPGRLFGERAIPFSAELLLTRSIKSRTPDVPDNVTPPP